MMRGNMAGPRGARWRSMLRAGYAALMDPASFSRLFYRVLNVGVDPADSRQIALQKRLLTSLSLIPIPSAIAWSAVYFAAGVTLAGVLVAGHIVGTMTNLVWFARSRRYSLFLTSQLLLIIVLPWLLTLILGGFAASSVVIIWAALAPLSAVVLGNLRQASIWLIAFAALLASAAAAEPFLTPAALPDWFVTWFFALNIGAVITISFAVLYYFVRQRDVLEERAEMLFLNILPREISDALQAEQRTIASYHDAASILFADLVDFTPMAASMKPLALVDLLNEVFQCFDTLVEKYDLEKIKTIGDCYMVAAGVPRGRTDHAVAIVSLALDMQADVARQQFAGRQLAFRIGVNSGPVVAGVIGRKKFIYDLWGDAVNVASRMESQGQSGAIQITRRTYDLVAATFVCEPRGRVAVKGAGELEAWHVTGLRT
jgi:guanylate cyclase